jgi:hypothetical protein
METPNEKTRLKDKGRGCTQAGYRPRHAKVDEKHDSEPKASREQEFDRGD